MAGILDLSAANYAVVAEFLGVLRMSSSARSNSMTLPVLNLALTCRTLYDALGAPEAEFWRYWLQICLERIPPAFRKIEGMEADSRSRALVAGCLLLPVGAREVALSELSGLLSARSFRERMAAELLGKTPYYYADYEGISHFGYPDGMVASVCQVGVSKNFVPFARGVRLYYHVSRSVLSVSRVT